MSKNHFRDYYLPLADERSDGALDQQQREAAAAVFLARICIVSWIAVPSIVALAFTAWVY